jgi:hypothetical protein
MTEMKMTNVQSRDLARCRTSKAIARSSRRSLVLKLVDMPELHRAIDAGDARLLMLAPLSRRGLAPDWAFPIEVDETVVATAKVLIEEFDAVAIAALVIKTRAIPLAKFDAAKREEIASALADALIAGVL